MGVNAKIWILEEAQEVWDKEGKLKVQRGWQPGQEVLPMPEGGYIE